MTRFQAMTESSESVGDLCSRTDDTLRNSNVRLICVVVVSSCVDVVHAAPCCFTVEASRMTVSMTHGHASALITDS